LTAGNSSNLKLTSSITKIISVFTKLESESNGFSFWITNVYGPNEEGDRPSFFQELKELGNHIQGSWLMAGDFNSVCSPLERSTLNMTPNEDIFNEMVWDFSLQEIPLLDRVFTWTNMQNPPILSKLDRVLINAEWNNSLPNSVVILFQELPRIISPLKIEVSTNILCSQIFRYCNNRPLKSGFKDLVSQIWSNSPPKNDAMGTLVARVKNLRQKAKSWKKNSSTG
jgi:hypothetical protein